MCFGTRACKQDGFGLPRYGVDLQKLVALLGASAGLSEKWLAQGPGRDYEPAVLQQTPTKLEHGSMWDGVG